MRHYIPVSEREQYQPNEFYKCGHGCDNTTFSTLPRASEKLTELSFCTRCGASILFSTVNLPKRVGYPRSRRDWGEAVPVLQTSVIHEEEYFVQPKMF